MSDWETVGEKPYSQAEPEPEKIPFPVFAGLDPSIGNMRISFPSFSAGKSAMFIMVDSMPEDFIDSLSAGIIPMVQTFKTLKARPPVHNSQFFFDDMSNLFSEIPEAEPENWVNKRGLGKPKLKKPAQPRGNKLYGTSWKKRP